MRRIAVRNRLIRMRSHRAAREVRAAVAAQRRGLREDVANAATHGVGLLMAVAAVPVLIVLGALRGTPVHVVSFAVYGASLVLVYAASTLYHATRRPRLRHAFRILDHVAIYLLIAGTYTPVMLISVEGPWGWTLLSLVWVLAAGGCVFKVFFVGRFQRLSTTLYLVMGWLAVLAVGPLVEALPAVGLAWLVAGGLSYTFGVVFFAWERMPYNHAVWHLFVIAGSACHYVAMLLYVL
jgi:hemolysin III